MAEAKLDVCSLCSRSEIVQPLEGRMPDHAPDWITIQVSTTPVRTRLACPGCAHPILLLLNV